MDDIAEEDDTLSNKSRASSTKEYGLINQLFSLVEDGEMSRIKEFLQDNPHLDINRYDHRGQTAMHVAAASGHREVMELLISVGADISILNKKGDHILHTAAKMGNLDVIRFIKDSGVDLNVKNKDGETALHHATRSNNLHALEFLCSNGADINLEDKNGEVPLHVACWCKQPKMLLCHLLCSGNCNINVKNKEGEAPIHFASGRGSAECVKVLIDNNADINIVDKRGSTSLHLACRRGHVEVAMLLLRNGCQLDVIDQLGETALHPACHNNLVPVVQTMCAYGCRVDVVNKSGSCPLHISTRTGHIEAVRCLLLSGVPAHQITENGVTAEVLAISQGHNDIAELFSGIKDKQFDYIRQLLPDEARLERIKMKFFGNSGVGKTALIESLKCGFIGGLLRRAGLGGGGVNESQHAYCLSAGLAHHHARENSFKSKKNHQTKTTTHLKVPKKKSKRLKVFTRRKSKDDKKESIPEICNPCYTKGIAIQQAHFSGSGDFSVWEFSGFEPYSITFDHFIGDPNCLHAVIIKAGDDHEKQLRQICYWLEFIKIRLPVMETLGKSGRYIQPFHILLIATHSNEINIPISQYRSKLNRLHFETVTMFSGDFSIYPKILSVDSGQPTSPEMKVLRNVLGEMRQGILQNIPSTTQFFNATISALPSWHKNLDSFPVVTWSKFKENVRLNVNMLACEEHLKSLVYFLQLSGEIVFLEAKRLDKSLVIINPRWLGQDLISTVLDQSIHLVNDFSDGIFTRDDLLLHFLAGVCGDLYGSMRVLQALGLVSILEDEQVDIVYEFASHLRLSRPPDREIWDPEDVRFESGIFGGVRLLPFASTSRTQLRSIFPRIQTKAREYFDLSKSNDNSSNEESDNERTSQSCDDDNLNELRLWLGGFKCTRGNIEVLVTEDRDSKQDWIEIKARGQNGTALELFHFFHETLTLIISAVEICTPSLEFQYQHLSPQHLSEYKNNVNFYLPKHILLAQKHGKNRVSKQETLNSSEPASNCIENNSADSNGDSTLSSMASDGTECQDGELLTDILAFGSQKIYEGLTPALDIPLRLLPMGPRRRLCALLDPSNPTGRDWCLLSVFLGQTDEIHLIDREAFSRTDQVLKRWSMSRDMPTLGMLMEKLEKIERQDAVDVLMNFSPSFEFVEALIDSSIHRGKINIIDELSVGDSKEDSAF